MTTDPAEPIAIGPWESTLLQPGPDSAETIVFLHGFMGSPDDWRPITDQLPLYRSIGLAAPDTTRDVEPIGPIAPGGIEVAADALAAWLTEHELTNAHLCGYSMGARMLIATVARHASIEPASLTLLAGSPGIADTERPARLSWDLRNARALRDLGLERFLHAWYENDVFASVREKPEVLTALVRAKAGQSAELLARQVIAYSPARMANYWQTLPKLAAPTLLIAGEDDAKYTHVCSHMEYQMLEAQTCSIPNAGHTLLAEAADSVACALKRFLSEHEQP